MDGGEGGGEGLLLGDLQVSGVNVFASGFVVRIGGRDGNDMGRIFLDLELPPGWARGDEEWVAAEVQAGCGIPSCYVRE